MSEAGHTRIAVGVPTARDTSLPRAVVGSALHRIDAWGVALIVCLIALLVHDAVTPHHLLLALAVATAYGLGYAVNDWFDAGFDGHDPSKVDTNPFVRHSISTERARGLFALALAPPLVVFVSFGFRGIAIFAVCVLVMWSYSAPPLRLKARPGLDLLTHALFVQTFAYFICLFLTGVEWLRLDAWILGINFLASLSGQLAQQVRDFEVDSRTERNFTTTVGLPMASLCLRVATVALVAVGVAGLVLGGLPWILAPLALAFFFSGRSRLRGGERAPSAAQIVLPTTAALAYTAALVIAQLS